MSPMWTRSKTQNGTLLTLLTLFTFTNADLSLQKLQAIADFPAACQAAYQTPIQSCPDAKAFSLSGSTSGTSVCTQDCFNALNRASANIQRACQGTSAPPNTVIAHAFSGDLAVWLCSVNSGGGSGSSGSSQPTSNSSPGNTASASSVSSPSSGATTDGSGSQSTSRSTSKSDSNAATSSSSNSASQASATSASSSSSNQSSSASSKSMSQPPPKSTFTPSPSSSKSSSSSSASSKPAPTLGPGGGGSPFDQVVPNTAPPTEYSPSTLSLLLGIAVAIMILKS